MSKNENIIWIDAFLFACPDFAANIASSVVSRSNVTGSVLIFNACSKVRFHSATLQFRWMKGPPQCLVRFLFPYMCYRDHGCQHHEQEQLRAVFTTLMFRNC